MEITDVWGQALANQKAAANYAVISNSFHRKVLNVMNQYFVFLNERICLLVPWLSFPAGPYPHSGCVVIVTGKVFSAHLLLLLIFLVIPSLFFIFCLTWAERSRGGSGREAVCVSWTVPDSSKWMERLWQPKLTVLVCPAVRGKQPGRGVKLSAVCVLIEVRRVWVRVLETPGSSVCQAWRCYWSNGLDVSYSSKTHNPVQLQCVFIRKYFDGKCKVIPAWSLWHAMRKISVDA